MLSGEYNFLVDNKWLAEIIAVILLIIPFFLFFADKKWIFGFYVVSIVANLPLIFVMVFGFSYEMIIALVIIAVIIRDLIRNKNLLLLSTKESRAVFFSLCGLLALNLATSLFNFSKSAFLERSFVYLVNVFILIIFNFFLINRGRLQIIRYGFVIGALLIVLTMAIELIYGYNYLQVGRLRPAGLLLDPNVSAFALNLALLLSFYKQKRPNSWTNVFFIISRILIVFGIFMTVSRSGYVLALIILVFFLIEHSKKKNYFAPLAALFMIVIYFIFQKPLAKTWDNLHLLLDLQRIFPRPSPPGPSGPGPALPGPILAEPRYELLKAGIKIFLHNFSLGIGIGNVPPAMEELTGMRMNTHNLVLQLLAESGIFMLVMLLVFFYYLVNLIIKSGRKERFLLGLILFAVAVESLFNHNLLNINIVYLLLAFFLALNILYSKEQTALSFAQIKNWFRR